jgi:mRNA interferase MazF
MNTAQLPAPCRIGDRDPFEVEVPPGLKVSGAILSDQIKNLDWSARNAALLCALPDSIVRQVLGKVGTLLTP